MIEDQFINKYKDQYYNDQTIEQLRNQQKQLLNLLSSINNKLNKQINKKDLCMIVKNKSMGNKKSGENTNVRKIQDKENQNSNGCSLPVLVSTNAQIVNSQKYHKILQKQKQNIEKRIQQHVSNNATSISVEISSEGKKVAQLKKHNKNLAQSINKAGQQIVSQPKSHQFQYDKLSKDITDKKIQIQNKNKTIDSNIEKAYDLQQNIQKLNPKIESISKEIPPEQLKTINQSQLHSQSINQSRITKNVTKNSTEISDQLSLKKQKLTINIQSIRKRLNQQYHSKLKQLESQHQRNTQIDEKSLKIDTKVKQLKQQIIIQEQKCKQIKENHYRNINYTNQNSRRSSGYQIETA